MKQLLMCAVLLVLFGCGSGSGSTEAGEDSGVSFRAKYAGTWGYDDATTKIRAEVFSVGENSTIHVETYDQNGLTGELEAEGEGILVAGSRNATVFSAISESGPLVGAMVGLALNKLDLTKLDCYIGIAQVGGIEVVEPPLSSTVSYPMTRR